MRGRIATSQKSNSTDGYEAELIYENLSDIAEIKKGQSITSASLLPGKIPVIAGGKSPAYYHAFSNRKEPCITVSASGAYAGYVAFHTQPIFASDCSTIVAKDKALTKFLYYCLILNQKIIYGLQTGGAQPHVQPVDLKRIEVSLPPLEEQQAIAEVLSDADAYVESLDDLIEKKKNIKQAVMQELFKGVQDAGMFKTIGEIAFISTGKAKQRGGFDYVIVDMGSVDSNGNLLKHKLTNDSSDLLDVDDLVMPKDDIGGGNIIGKVVIIDKLKKYVLGDHVYRLKVKSGYPPFIRYAINSHSVNKSIRSQVVGSAQLGISKSAIWNQKIPFPTEVEQIRIAEILTDIDAEIDALAAQRDKAELVKQGMMQELLSGRTRLV